MSQATLCDFSGKHCPTCGDLFGSQRGVSVHHANTHGETIKEYRHRVHGEGLRCPECGDVGFKNRQGLGTHLSSIHGETLKERERRRSIPENPHECPECGECFANEWGLNIHYGHMHDGSIAGIEIECETCGKTFHRQRALAEDSERNFCDRDCYAEWRSEFVSGEGNPMYGVDGEDAPAYGRTGEQNPMHGRTGLDNPMGGVTGPDHPGWEGGTEPGYGSNWKRQRRKAIERDGGVCQMDECDMDRDGHREEYSKDISVHHITRKKYFRRWSESCDDVELEDANVLRNVITLCIKCNNRVDKYGWESPLPDSHWRSS